MSHYSEVQIEIKDGAALVAALERLGAEEPAGWDGNNTL